MPARLSPAHLAVLKSADRKRVTRSLYSPTRWYETGPFHENNVTRTVESLIRLGLLEAGRFEGLGVPHVAEFGHAVLAETTITNGDR